MQTVLNVASVSSIWSTAVGKFGQCSVSPDTARFDVTEQWEVRVQRSSSNGSIFGRTSNLYVTDRCFVPRRVCKFRLRHSGAELLLPREGPSSIHVLPRQYHVVLGAAQVVGVLARTSFASILEQGGFPVLNLGRGAAGPHVYTDPGNWPHIGPLMSNARAVIICVMAGRSSPSSESGRFSGQSFGGEQIRAYNRVLGLWQQGGRSRKHAERLRLETLANARLDYVDLIGRIRRGAAASGVPPPRVLLVWFSPCPLSGCTELWQYPQYYLAEGDVADAGGGEEPHALSALARAADAEVVDASYGHLPPSPPLPIDLCVSCTPHASIAAVCNSIRARQDAKSAGRLCGHACGAVNDPYYPDDIAHEHAAKLIREALRRSPRKTPAVATAAAAAATAAATATTAAAAVGAVGASGGPSALTKLTKPTAEEVALRPITLEHKLFHWHIHKASGTTFLGYLSGLDGVISCASEAGGNLIRGDHTRPNYWPSFERWWNGRRPGCTFASLEEPELGELYGRMAAEGAAHAGNHAAKHAGKHAGKHSGAQRALGYLGGRREALGKARGDVAAAPSLPLPIVPQASYNVHPAEPLPIPQLVSFFRHPFARCRSHWKYEQSLCHRPADRMAWHAHYCKHYFLPRYGAFNDTATHARFADEYCADKATRSLTAANGMEDARGFLLRKLVLHRITEHAPSSDLLPPTSYLLPPTSYLPPPTSYLLPPTSDLLLPIYFPGGVRSPPSPTGT